MLRGSVDRKTRRRGVAGWRLCGCVLLLLLGGVARAHAQELYVEPRIAVGWETSDNLFLVSSAAADLDAALRPVSDAYWLVAPGLTLEARGRYASLALRYDIGRTAYQSFGALDGWRHDLAVGLALGIAPDTALTLQHAYLQTDDMLRLGGTADTPLFEADPGALSVQERFTINTTTAGLLFTPGEVSTLTLGGAYTARDAARSLDGYTRRRVTATGTRQWTPDWSTQAALDAGSTDFDDSPDVEERLASLELERRLTTDWRTGLYGSYRQVRLEEPATDEVVSAAGAGYRVITPEVGFARMAADGLQLSVRLGAYLLTPRDVGDDTSGFSGSLRLARSFERGQVGLRAVTGHGDAFYSSERFDSSEYYLAGISGAYDVTPTLSLSLAASYRSDRYDLERLVEGALVASTATSDSKLLTVGLHYEPRDWVEGSLVFDHLERDSLTISDDYEENRIGVMLTFRRPTRMGDVPARARPLPPPL